MRLRKYDMEVGAEGQDIREDMITAQVSCDRNDIDRRDEENYEDYDIVYMRLLFFPNNAKMKSNYANHFEKCHRRNVA